MTRRQGEGTLLYLNLIGYLTLLLPGLAKLLKGYILLSVNLFTMKGVGQGVCETNTARGLPFQVRVIMKNKPHLCRF